MSPARGVIAHGQHALPRLDHDRVAPARPPRRRGRPHRCPFALGQSSCRTAIWPAGSSWSSHSPRGILINVKVENVLERRPRSYETLDGRTHASPLHQTGRRRLPPDAPGGAVRRRDAGTRGRGRPPRPRSAARRATARLSAADLAVADRLAGLLRDYEYHRQDRILDAWRRGMDAYPDPAPATWTWSAGTARCSAASWTNPTACAVA